MTAMQRWDDEWDDSEHSLQPGAREWGPHEPFGTEEAARIGLDRNTVEGAQLAFFSHLDARKLSHRLTALTALTLLSGWPVLQAFERIAHS